MRNGDINDILWDTVVEPHQSTLYTCEPETEIEMMSPLGLIYGLQLRGALDFSARLELGEYYENHICRFLALSGLAVCKFEKFGENQFEGPTLIVEGKKVAAPDRVVISREGKTSFVEIKQRSFFTTMNSGDCVGMSKRYYDQYLWTASKWQHIPFSVFFVVTDDFNSENNGLYHIGRNFLENLGYWVASDRYDDGFVYWSKSSLTKVPGYIPIPVHARAN